jgi:hypothetical protein
MAQVVEQAQGPEFKSQYCQKYKRKQKQNKTNNRAKWEERIRHMVSIMNQCPLDSNCF